jgi:Type III secretion protein (HpaP)
MNNSASPGNVSQTGAQAASAIKSARMITRAEQFQFESHFDSAATSGAGAQAADFSESWDSADTGKPESSDIGGDGVNELTSERDTRVSEQRQRDSQGGSDDAKSGDDSDTPTFPLHLDAIASQAFVHPFQLLAGVVSGSALTANLQAEQPRASACWSQLSEGVNRLLVNTDPHALNAPAAVLKLDSSLLPNTTLTLVRVPEGWVLQVHSQAFEVRRALRAHADELQERFARLSLGHLRVEAVENTSDDLFL